MVILGGLELVAAGYVLNELRKDEEKPRSSDDRRRRRRHDSHSHSHSHHRRDSDNRPRPPRPDTLAPPIIAPLRPNSAPPQQTFQPRPGGGGPFPPGPWMNQMPIQQQQQQQQQNPPFQQIPHPQTWPHPNGGPNPQMPPNQNPSRPMYLASDFPPNPYQRQQMQSQPQPQPPPPGPGNLAHRPTMHFDLKTGKWQSDMLPPEMPRSGSVPAGAGTTSRDRSASQQPPSRLRQERRRGSISSDSYSSSSDSSDNDENLAYGSLPGERRRRRRHGGESRQRFVSRDRQRPPPYTQPARDSYGGDWNGRTASMPVEMPHQIRYELQG